MLACVASVSNRVFARKLESQKKKKERGNHCSLLNFLDELARKRLLRRLKNAERIYGYPKMKEPNFGCKLNGRNARKRQKILLALCHLLFEEYLQGKENHAEKQ